MSRGSTKSHEFGDFISQAEAARIRSVSIQAIADLIKREKLTGHKIGGRTFVLRSEVEAFVPAPKLGRPRKNVETKKRDTKSTSKRVSPSKKTGSKKATPKKTTD